MPRCVLQKFNYTYAVLGVIRQLAVLCGHATPFSPGNRSLHRARLIPTAIAVRLQLTNLAVRLPQSACSQHSAWFSRPPTLVLQRSEFVGLGTSIAVDTA